MLEVTTAKVGADSGWFGLHCHAIKIKIENHSMKEVKKLTPYRR